MDNLILSLLLNLKLFFCGLSTTVDFEINLKDHSDEDFIEVELRVSRIDLTDDLICQMDIINFGNTGSLKPTDHPDLFTLRQAVLDLKGKLHFAIHHRSEVLVHMIIPKKGKPEELMHQ